MEGLVAGGSATCRLFSIFAYRRDWVAVSTTIRKMVGSPTDGILFEIEKWDIRRYAKAIGETNGIHFDEKMAVGLGYKSLVAPLTFACSLNDFEVLFSKLEVNPHSIMHAEEEYEYFMHIVAGAKVVVTHTVLDAYEKQAPNGRLIFIVIETRGCDLRSKPYFKGRRVVVEIK